MKRATVFLAVIAVCTVSSVYAMSTGGPGGTWPKSWPKELEPLREQAWTWADGVIMSPSYDISFASREEFESAWPHIVKLKSEGATLTLLRGPHIRVITDKSPKGQTAGVRILTPLKGVSTGPLSTTRIGLVVDGDIVDLNRIPLPADTPIIDKRFKDADQKASNPTAKAATDNAQTQPPPAASIKQDAAKQIP